jgi:hypothetical protein
MLLAELHVRESGTQIPGRNSSLARTGVGDIEGIAIPERAWGRQESRCGVIEGVGTIGTQPRPDLFQARDSRIVYICGRTIVARQRTFRTRGNHQGDGHNTNQQQDENGDKQRNSGLLLTISPCSSHSHFDWAEVVAWPFMPEEEGFSLRSE